MKGATIGHGSGSVVGSWPRAAARRGVTRASSGSAARSFHGRRRRARRNHPPDCRRIPDRRHRRRGPLERRIAGRRPSHSRRTARVHAHYRLPHDRGARPGRRLRRAVRVTRGVCRVRAHDCGRRGGHGSRHPHRRGAPGLRRRSEDRRDGGEEGGVGYRGLRAVARRGATQKRGPCRAGGPGEPGVHRRGGRARLSASRRPHRH